MSLAHVGAIQWQKMRLYPIFHTGTEGRFMTDFHRSLMEQYQEGCPKSWD
jgi:hypothetical protein